MDTTAGTHDDGSAGNTTFCAGACSPYLLPDLQLMMRDCAAVEDRDFFCITRTMDRIRLKGLTILQ